MKNFFATAGILMMLAVSFISTCSAASADTLRLSIDLKFRGGTQKAYIDLGNDTATSVDVVCPVDSRMLKSGRTSFRVNKNDMDRIRAVAGTSSLLMDLSVPVYTAIDKDIVSIHFNTDDAKTGSRLYLMENNGGDQRLTSSATGTIGKGGAFSLSFDGSKTRAAVYNLVRYESMKVREKAVWDALRADDALELSRGDTGRIRLTGCHADSEIRRIRYNSSKYSVIKIDKDGSLYARKDGTSKIKTTVTLATGRTKCLTTKVTVK